MRRHRRRPLSLTDQQLAEVMAAARSPRFGAQRRFPARVSAKLALSGLTSIVTNLVAQGDRMTPWRR